MLGVILPVAAVAGVVNPFGGNAWPIYGFSNGNVLYNLLYAAKGLVNSPGYWDLIMLTAMAAILPIGYAAAHQHKKAKQGLGLFIGLLVITSIGIRTTANAVIIDSVTGYTNAIKDAPALVVLPESIISSLGHEASMLIEQFYATPASLQVAHGGGFDLANSLVQDSTHIQVSDPMARATLAAFTRNCIIPGIASGRLSSYALVTSTQLWDRGGKKGTLARSPQSPLTPVYTAQDTYGAMLPCGPKGVAGGQTAYATYNGTQYKDAYDYLSAYFQGEAPKWLAQSAATFSGTSTFSWLSGTLASAQTFLFGGALTKPTGETIEQAAAINALRPALNAAAIASGQSQAVTALAVAQGEKSQVSSWATGAIIFRDLAGYLYSVLQAFVMALLPLIMVALFIPGAGHRIAMTTMQVLFWLALWEPTLSIVDYIVDLYSQGTLGPVMGKTGGYSMMNLGVISTQTSHLMLAAGFVSSMVPLITWGLVKGGFAFTEFLTHGLGTALAAQAGAMAATGNISLDQQSFNNRSIGQEMLMYKETAGTGEALTSMAGADATEQVNQGGVDGLVAGNKITNVISARASRGERQAETVANNASQTASADSSRAYAQGTISAIKAMQGVTQSDSAGNRGSLAHDRDVRHAAEATLAASLQDQAGDSTKVGQDLARMAQGGISPTQILDGFKAKAAEGDKAAAGIVSKTEGWLAGHKSSTSAEFYASLKGAVDASSNAQQSLSGQQGNLTKTSAGYATKAAQALDYAHSLQRLANLTQASDRNDSETLKQAAGLATSSATSYQTAETATDAAEKFHAISMDPGLGNVATVFADIRSLEGQVNALPDPMAGPAGAPKGYAGTKGGVAQKGAALAQKVQNAAGAGAAAARGAMPGVARQVGNAGKAVGQVPGKMSSLSKTLRGKTKNLSGSVRDPDSNWRTGNFNQTFGKAYNRNYAATQTNYDNTLGVTGDRLASGKNSLTNFASTLIGMPAPADGSQHLGRSQVELVGGATLVGMIPDKVLEVGAAAAGGAYALAKGIEWLSPNNPNAYSGEQGIDMRLPGAGAGPTAGAGDPGTENSGMGSQNPGAYPGGDSHSSGPTAGAGLAAPAAGAGGLGTENSGMGSQNLSTYPGGDARPSNLAAGILRTTNQMDHPFSTDAGSNWQGPSQNYYDNYFVRPQRLNANPADPVNRGMAATATAHVVLSGKGSDSALNAATKW
jgi:hypothetical protein